MYHLSIYDLYVTASFVEITAMYQISQLGLTTQMLAVPALKLAVPMYSQPYQPLSWLYQTYSKMYRAVQLAQYGNSSGL